MRVALRLSRHYDAWRRLHRRLRRRFSGAGGHRRGPATLVVILDGTLSSLERGQETNAGLAWKLLTESGARADRFIYYEAGLQWDDWASTRDVITGRGLNRKIERAYGFLASRYRPGDRIFLFGFSRGAFAVRSLAGAIHRIGLPRAEHATVRTIRQAYRHYRCAPDTAAAAAFTRLHCHSDVPIEMIGVWDTVKALGLRVPLLWRLTEPQHAFHNHHLCPNVRHGFHALAHDETREAYVPELWLTDGHPGRIEQRWFRGTHGDIGGQLMGIDAARPLANIPLVWVLSQAETLGLALPEGWAARFPCDAAAPSIGTVRGWGKAFLLRRRRAVGRDASEVVDLSVGVCRPVRPGLPLPGLPLPSLPLPVPLLPLPLPDGWAKSWRLAGRAATPGAWPWGRWAGAPAVGDGMQPGQEAEGPEAGMVARNAS